MCECVVLSLCLSLLSEWTNEIEFVDSLSAAMSPNPAFDLNEADSVEEMADEGALLEVDAEQTPRIEYDMSVINEEPDRSHPTAADLAALNASFKKCAAGPFTGLCHSTGMVCNGVYNDGACAGAELCCLPRGAPTTTVAPLPLVRSTAKPVAAVLAPVPFVQSTGTGGKCGAGNVGTCKERSTGCTGLFQAGLCAGAATVQCCLPAAPATAGASTGVCSKSAQMANMAVRRGLAASKGACAKYVGDYIQSQLPGYVRTLYARDTGANLLKAGFKALPSGAQLMPGDVRVIQPIPGHPAGHMVRTHTSAYTQKHTHAPTATHMLRTRYVFRC